MRLGLSSDEGQSLVQPQFVVLIVSLHRRVLATARGFAPVEHVDSAFLGTICCIGKSLFNKPLSARVRQYGACVVVFSVRQDLELFIWRSQYKPRVFLATGFPLLFASEAY